MVDRCEKEEKKSRSKHENWTKVARNQVAPSLPVAGSDQRVARFVSDYVRWQRESAQIDFVLGGGD